MLLGVKRGNFNNFPLFPVGGRLSYEPIVTALLIHFAAWTVRSTPEKFILLDVKVSNNSLCLNLNNRKNSACPCKQT